MLKNLIFATDINKINKNTLILHYIFFSIIVAVLSYLYCNLFINRFDNLVDSNHHIILKNLPFDYGKLSHNIFYHSDFSFIDNDNVLYYLKRLLFFPILIVLLAKISCQLIFVDASNNSNQKKNYNILKNYKNCKILIQKHAQHPLDLMSPYDICIVG